MRVEYGNFSSGLLGIGVGARVQFIPTPRLEELGSEEPKRTLKLAVAKIPSSLLRKLHCGKVSTIF